MKTIYLLFLCSTVFSQKIKHVEIDKFTGAKRIETDFNKIGGAFMSWIGYKFSTNDTTIFITFNGTVGLGVVGPATDPTTFLFADKTTFNVFPTDVQSYEGLGSSAHYEHQYYISKGQLETLSKNHPISLRRIYSHNYVDVDIKPKFGEGISKLAAMVLEEMNKH